MLSQLLPRGIAVRQFLCNGACNGARSLSSSPSPQSHITDQMVQYVMKECRGKHDQAVDVLRSGLNMHPEETGVSYARLMATMASVESDRNNWSEVSSCTQKATSAVSGADAMKDPAAASPLLAAGTMGIRTLLAQGEDASAINAADAAGALARQEPSFSSVSLASLGLRLSCHHAAGKWEQASQLAEQLAQAARGRGGHSSVQQGLSGAFAALGHWHAAQRGAGPDAEVDAMAAYSEGVQCASPEAARCSPEWSVEEAEARASCLAGQAGLAVRSSKWDQAEEVLGQALQVAEGISTDAHPRVVPILTQLGYVYSRSARVMFAEGLFRECSKILKLDPGRPTTWNAQPLPLHPNLVAMLAWRFHQLLAVMPNRGSEAGAWEQVARTMWSKAGASKEESLEGTFGGSKHLSGQDGAGAGLVVALQWRRGLPVHFGMGV